MLPLVLMLWVALGAAVAAPRRIHVVVALADNATQGIAPVPAKIGNGDDAASNLYWGASEGFRSVFAASRDWKLDRTEANPSPEVLERRTFHHATAECVLVAEAWRGRDIREALASFFQHLRDRRENLVAFVGHERIDGWGHDSHGGAGGCGGSRGHGAVLQERRMVRAPYCGPESPAGPHNAATHVSRFLLLRDALAVWLRNGSRTEIRAAAGRSYAKNQGTPVKAATGVFSALE